MRFKRMIAMLLCTLLFAAAQAKPPLPPSGRNTRGR